MPESNQVQRLEEVLQYVQTSLPNKPNLLAKTEPPSEDFSSLPILRISPLFQFTAGAKPDEPAAQGREWYEISSLVSLVIPMPSLHVLHSLTQYINPVFRLHGQRWWRCLRKGKKTWRTLAGRDTLTELPHANHFSGERQDRRFTFKVPRSMSTYGPITNVSSSSIPLWPINVDQIRLLAWCTQPQT